MSISNLTYAIGDIHGRFDLLSSLLDFIQSDADRRHQEPKVIFLGDIIDRGPNSKDCIEFVTLTLKRWPKSRLMLGNHDDYFLQVMGTEKSRSEYSRFLATQWGYATVLHYDYDGDLKMARAGIKIDY